MLKALKPYPGNNVVNNTFIEKYSLPRGKYERWDVYNFETALRETIEETGMCCDVLVLFTNYFKLCFKDETVMHPYTYNMYYARTVTELYSIPYEPNTFNVKLCLKSTSKCTREYDVYIQPRGVNQEPIRDLIFMSHDNYVKEMRNQLTAYEKSNYMQMFDYMYRVDKMYESVPFHESFLRIKLNIK